ncbi:MAG: TonB-dependent receptor, partial [Balneolaceae bacterium]
LRETEIGTYLDGTRIFPAGPARMDSPLSHLDPAIIESIEVVKGPYALNWGAGNMSAIRVQTQPLHTLNTQFGGKVMSGYDSNFNTFEEAASVYGRSGKVGYLLSGTWRSGNDYRSGNGTDIPGEYLSREVRGKAAYATSSNSHLTLSLGYQNQEDIDYPGRLLDADYFDTYNASAGWEWNPQKDNLLQNIRAKVYLNDITHGMDNDDKPTAQPDPDRMPPFATDVQVDTKSKVYGGNLAATLSTGPGWEWEIGSDIYSSYREAMRTIARRDNGQELSFNLIWPEATIINWGLYNRFSYSFSDRISATASLRLDLVSANADTIGEFFEQNVSTDLDSREGNLSASGTMNYRFSDNWTLGLGLGSVVRTADATERYSDRQPASKAQTSAEFVGNPTLEPERSTQADLWLDGSYEKISISLNGFVRHMDNYITLEATDLPKRQPMSPETVYQYINGSARFTGFDLSARYRIIDPLQIHSSFSYLWGEDTELEEPALGVSPLSGAVDLRYDFVAWPIFVESTVNYVGEQDRVATARGETPTDGYTLVDLLAGWSYKNTLTLQLGIKNLFDRQYVNHLNAKNPYTTSPIAEPGRVFFGDITIQF